MDRAWELTQGSLRSHFSFEALHREHDSVYLRTPASEPPGALLRFASTILIIVGGWMNTGHDLDWAQNGGRDIILGNRPFGLSLSLSWFSVPVNLTSRGLYEVGGPGGDTVSFPFPFFSPCTCPLMRRSSQKAWWSWSRPPRAPLKEA